MGNSGGAHGADDLAPQPDVPGAVRRHEHTVEFPPAVLRLVRLNKPGEIIFDGSPDAVTRDTRVRQAYLGSYADARSVA